MTPAFILLFLRTLCPALVLGILPKSELLKSRLNERQTTAGRLGDLPSLPAFPPALFFILVGGNAHPSQRRTKAPTPRFAVPEVYGYHSVCREGTNRLKRADTGILVLGLRLGRTIGRETLPGNQRSSSSFRNFFEKIILSRNPLLLFYVTYLFPSRCFQDRTFSRYSVSGEGSLSLLSFVLLIYFLPISWRGSPPPDGGRKRFAQQPFKSISAIKFRKSK